MIFWCKSCEIPYYSNGDTPCTICKEEGNKISKSNLVPVFEQEKKLLSHILEQDLSNKNIWFKERANYIIDGINVSIPYVKFYKEKKYIEIAQQLKEEIVYDSSIYNEDKFVEANRDYIDSLIYEAEKYIVDIVEELSNDCVPTISFSGGKDSTVVSRLVRDALQKKDIIHFLGDTTIEFPHTYKYYDEVFRKENKFTPLVDIKPNNDFFKMCKVFPPPSQYERWCCTIFKTSNLNSFLHSLPETMKSLTFMGIRRSESNSRKKYHRTQYKSKIAKQVVAMPIIDWSDFDVWLYIKYKKLEFNDAYKLGYRRVGCWCCPNNSQWSELLTAIYLPEYHEKWRKILYDFAVKSGKIDIQDYVENGKWKARRGSSGLESKNIDINDTDCNLDNTARNLILSKSLDEKFIEFLRPFGSLRIYKREENVLINVYENEKKVFLLEYKLGSKILKVIPYEIKDILVFLKRIKCQIRKYQFCIYCSACDASCPKLAISTLHGRYIIDEEKCDHCKICISKFYNGCLTTEMLAGRKTKKDVEEDKNGV